jgi:DNA-binding transcriptional MerR regulator
MEKKYFIEELERILGVNRKNYYYWEKKGKVPRARRTAMGNYRYWYKEDIDKLKDLIER